MTGLCGDRAWDFAVYVTLAEIYVDRLEHEELFSGVVNFTGNMTP